jgi:hypothetical protein
MFSERFMGGAKSFLYSRHIWWNLSDPKRTALRIQTYTGEDVETRNEVG